MMSLEENDKEIAEIKAGYEKLFAEYNTRLELIAPIFKLRTNEIQLFSKWLSLGALGILSSVALNIEDLSVTYGYSSVKIFSATCMLSLYFGFKIFLLDLELIIKPVTLNKIDSDIFQDMSEKLLSSEKIDIIKSKVKSIEQIFNDTQKVTNNTFEVTTLIRRQAVLLATATVFLFICVLGFKGNVAANVENKYQQSP